MGPIDYIIKHPATAIRNAMWGGIIVGVILLIIMVTSQSAVAAIFAVLAGAVAVASFCYQRTPQYAFMKMVEPKEVFTPVYNQDPGMGLSRDASPHPASINGAGFGDIMQKFATLKPKIALIANGVQDLAALEIGARTMVVASKALIADPAFPSLGESTKNAFSSLSQDALNKFTKETEGIHELATNLQGIISLVA